MHTATSFYAIFLVYFCVDYDSLFHIGYGIFNSNCDIGSQKISGWGHSSAVECWPHMHNATFL